MATTEMIMVRRAMGVSLLEHRRNEEIVEEGGTDSDGCEKEKVEMVQAR